MKINCIAQNTNFGANHIRKEYILKHNDKGNYESCPAHFVEIDNRNINDLNAIENVAKYWKDSLYADNIYDTALNRYFCNPKYKNYRVYALTLQQDDFRYLDDDKILGITEVYFPCEKKDTVVIDHIESYPSSCVLFGIPKYKGIGSAMLRSLQSFCKRIDLISRDSKGVHNFYKKNGFKECPAESNIFCWTK